MGISIKKVKFNSRGSRSDALSVAESAPILPISTSVTLVSMASQWTLSTQLASNAMMFVWLARLRVLPIASLATLDGPSSNPMTEQKPQAHVRNALTPVAEYAQILKLAPIAKIHFISDLMENVHNASVIVRFALTILHALNVTMVILSTPNKMDLNNANYAKMDALHAQSWLIVKSVTLDFSWTPQAKLA